MALNQDHGSLNQGDFKIVEKASGSPLLSLKLTATAVGEALIKTLQQHQEFNIHEVRPDRLHSSDR